MTIKYQRRATHSNRKAKLIFLLRSVIFDKKFLRVQILVILSGLISLLTLVYNNIAFSCELYFVQNILLTFFATSFFLDQIEPSDRSQGLISGAAAGAVFGAIPATISLLISNIRYYFFGVREAGFLAGGLPIPTLTFELLLVGLSSQIILWLELVLVSAIVGLIAALNSTRKHN